MGSKSRGESRSGETSSRPIQAIQPALVEGQIEGGSLQAVGFSHLEVATYASGRFLQDRLATCIIPTTLDSPPFEVLLVEEPFPGGPFGAKGVGELPMDGGAPAAVAAVESATGIWADEIPATPERLAAWQEAGEVVEGIAGEVARRSGGGD